MSDLRKNDGGPAFPVETYGDGRGAQTSPATGWETGMSLRDYFAAQALASVIAKCVPEECYFVDAHRGVREPMEEMFARKAYGVADAMIARRAQISAEGSRG